MPLIRYNTGDLVTVVEEKEEIPEKFSIAQGREGDYIIDKNGKHIPLTALIFGRHHDAFNECKFIQISQNESGTAQIHVTLNYKTKTEHEILQMFDLSNIDVDFSVSIRTCPFRATAGKTPLKIPN